MCPGVVNARRPASLPRQQAAAPVVTGPCSPARGGGWFGFWGVITVAAACFDAERAPLGHGLTSRAVCPGPALLPQRPGFADLSQGRGGEASSFPSGHGHSQGTGCADGPRGLALAKAEDPARPRSHREPCTWTGQGRPWALCPHGGCLLPPGPESVLSSCSLGMSGVPSSGFGNLNLVRRGEPAQLEKCGMTIS